MFPRYENRTDASSHPFIDGGTAEPPAHAQDAQVPSFGDVGVSRSAIPATIPDSATQIRTDTVSQHNRFRERNHVNYQNKPRCHWMALVRERSGRCIGPACLDRRIRSVARHAGAAAGQLGWSVDRLVNARDLRDRLTSGMESLDGACAPGWRIRKPRFSAHAARCRVTIGRCSCSP